VVQFALIWWLTIESGSAVILTLPVGLLLAGPGAERMGVPAWYVLSGVLIVGEVTAVAAARSEAWHESERGETFMGRIGLIEEAISLLHDLPEP